MINDRRTRPRPDREPPTLRFLCRVWSLIAYSDTTPTRFMLAIAATCWSVLLAWPGNTFERPVYFWMSQIGPEWSWALFWAIHAAGMWWRTFATTPRPRFALAINSLGVLLFTGAAVSIFLTLTYPLPAAIAADVVFAMASFWVLVRTHVNSEHGWRID